jgi:hypothetical protein
MSGLIINERHEHKSDNQTIPGCPTGGQQAVEDYAGGSMVVVYGDEQHIQNLHRVAVDEVLEAGQR